MNKAVGDLCRVQIVGSDPEGQPAAEVCGRPEPALALTAALIQTNGTYIRPAGTLVTSRLPREHQPAARPPERLPQIGAVLHGDIK